MHKTLLQTIIAAFCAILCTHLCVGGGGMNIGARTAAWAKSGYTAKDYVQDGLIAMWDGIENAGWGVHDPNATVWKDLSGNGNDLTITKAELWGDNFFNFDGTKCCYKNLNLNGAVYLESCFYSSSGRWILALTNSDGGISKFFSLSADRNFIMGRSPTLFRYPTQVTSSARTVGFDYSDGLIYYEDGIEIAGESYSDTWNNGAGVSVGFRPAGSYTGTGAMYRISAYSRSPTIKEIAANYAIDKARFGLP